MVLHFLTVLIFSRRSLRRTITTDTAPRQYPCALHGNFNMHTSATAGAVIYAKDLETMTAYYSHVLLVAADRGDGFAIIDVAGIRLTIHAIPARYANDIRIENPPARREDASVKLSFPVRSLEGTRRLASKYRGVVDNTTWDFNGRRYADGQDPEGNVVQFHERIDEQSEVGTL